MRVATLVAGGMDSATVYRRCQPGGPWRRLLPGIVVLQNAPPDQLQKVTAALLHAGPNAVVTGVEACRRLGMRLEVDDHSVHVLVPHAREMTSCGFVVVERTHRLPRPLSRQGLPLAPPQRAVLDAVRRLRERDVVAACLVEAMQRGKCSVAELRDELAKGSQRGSALPRRVLAQVDGLRSVAEVHGRRLSRHLGVAPSHWNARLLGSDSQYVGRPDAWWDDVGLAWEIDSVEFHFDRADYAKTLARNSRYARNGVVVVQTLPSRLLADRAAVIDELDAAYRMAATRPRPPVTIAAEP
ncbi:hypothetical protein [Saccharomonospora piscinae]|uniref:hypothetical protein n=1 Tax=Saccharomonospora piscinae TaxID=687388 RepID=UPI001FC9AEA8|nr:hypothetical protein [Saccharomonospora piscinae]